MPLKWAAHFALFFTTTLALVNADIECDYCGMRDMCTIPYVVDGSQKIYCKHSCMKFDGKDPDGKRVVVRSCGGMNSTSCRINEKWNGGIGELCYCNKPNCNIASSNETNAVMLFSILCLQPILTRLLNFLHKHKKDTITIHFSHY